MIEISLHDKVYGVVKTHPETRQIIVDLGFTHMKDDAMLNTAGKIMTLSKAAKRHKITFETMKTAFEAQGYSFKEETL